MCHYISYNITQNWFLKKSKELCTFNFPNLLCITQFLIILFLFSSSIFRNKYAVFLISFVHLFYYIAVQYCITDRQLFYGLYLFLEIKKRFFNFISLSILLYCKVCWGNIATLKLYQFSRLCFFKNFIQM